ncbi:MAG: PEP-CTERM sorting domain-containing protein [Kiritimatiellae bacterium]|nr:PEP-CTERM sorting domain-containing protein [Kiritimatiellia bacterium]
MKKLIMAAAVALAAIGLNAATVNWAATKGYLYDGASANKITTGSAYLMYVTAGYTQSDLVSAFAAANGDSSATLAAMSASGAMASGAAAIGDNARIAVSSSTSDLAAADGSVYFVVFNDDKMYVSITADALYDSVMGSSDASFASITASSKVDLQAADGYSAAGWYTAVPEPTSGLLMLLGMAGLALRRKRA